VSAASLTSEEFVGGQARCRRCRSREGRQETIHHVDQALAPPRTHRLGRSYEYDRYIDPERAEEPLSQTNEAGT
jgi:hypothetical protein